MVENRESVAVLHFLCHIFQPDIAIFSHEVVFFRAPFYGCPDEWIISRHFECVLNVYTNNIYLI